MIIGKRGEQPFQITGANVSAQHAELIIDPHTGIWTLKDLNSTNGTFIRDESTGDLRRISSKVIQPLTFVCLGSDNTKGCTFYARQLLNPGNYHDELLYIREKNEEFELALSKIDKTIQYVNILKGVLPVILFGLSMIIIPMESGLNWLMLVRILAISFPTMLIQLLYNPTEKKNAIKKTQSKFTHCPNPMCNYKLQAEHIKSMDCPSCHGI